MSAEYVVDALTLGLSADDWTDQGSRVRTAGDRIADAATGGFTPAVAAAVSGWTSAWGSTVGGVADRAEGVAAQLSDAAEAYTMTDVAAQERFQDWLGSTP